MVQLEEAYARATVAITRARALCLIMGPLDMKDLLGAATVMGTLMYGAGHVWAGHAHFYLHDHELSRSPPDETFIDMLQQNCCLSGPDSPPPAIVEALQDYVTQEEAGWLLLARHCQVPKLDFTVGRKCYNTSYGIWGRLSSLSSSPLERREVLLMENPVAG